MGLNADRVNEVFGACLFEDSEIVDGKAPDAAVVVHGITMTAGLHPGRLAAHKDEIRAMVDELPAEFDDGWSFLQMCVDRHGNHWAEHPTMQNLVLLGQATGALACLAPREMWPMLPGGMPYYQRTKAA